MLFEFLKYIQPIQYFTLFNSSNKSIFPIAERLSEEVLSQLDKDSLYKSKFGTSYDLSWQAIQKGYIGCIATIATIEELPIQDEYRFVRKYFSPIWATYCLMFRVLSFKNPFSEVKAWSNSKGVKRQFFSEGINSVTAWNSYDSKLLKETPKVSVIIPTLNRYNYLKNILMDFEQQDYKNFEILIVDQSDDFNPNFYKQFDLDIQLIQQEEKALWLARNTAIKKASGNLIALSEDDVRIKQDWISKHIKCLDYFNADISAGVFYPEGKEIPKERSFFAIAKQFATGNALLKKEVFKKTGLFDRQFEKGRMGDGAFGLRCFLEGFKSISNPYASCVDVKASTGGLREMGSWDAYRPTKWFAPRPVPSVLYYYRKYYGKRLAILQLLKTVPVSILPYRFKQDKKMMLLGIVISLIVIPIILLQVLRSWQLATNKLKQGALIDEL